MRWLFKPRRQSLWRGVISGLIAHSISVGVIVLLAAVLRPLIWTAIYGFPYVSPVGPVDPNSGEGATLQFLGMLSWIPGGFFAMRWGGASGKKSALTLLACLSAFLLLALMQDIPDMPPLRSLWYWLSSPLGLAAGVAIHLRRQNRLSHTTVQELS